jgi:phosphopantothenoylcysteine synthetase/decarboxylase
MTDKERLEMIKHDFEERGQYGGFIDDYDTQWLIEQAEKVVELERENKSLAMKIISEEEFEILQHWGFIASTERPLSKKEAELYFKITDV